MFIKRYIVGPVETNCYLLGDDTTHIAALVDPGESGTELVDDAEKDGFHITTIFLTHGHFDHISGVADAVQTLKARYPEQVTDIYINKLDYPFAPSSFDRGVTLSDVHGIKYYAENDVIALGTLNVKVIETPGHTKGGVCLIVNNVIFTGDTLFRCSCGRTDFESSSPVDMMKSLFKLSNLSGNYSVLPGHDSSSTLDFERENNPYMLYAISNSK